MIRIETATPERFSALAPEPTADLDRLQRNLARGSVRPEHLLVAMDAADDTDMARVGIFTHEDGASLAYAFQIVPGRSDLERVYGVLFDGVAAAARSSGLGRVLVTVVDADEGAPRAKRAALAAAGWAVDDDRLELEVPPSASVRGDGIAEIDPSDPEVVAVMAAAMAQSLDGYDRDQVAALGATIAAVVYRDMMARPDGPPWLAHRGPDGLDGVVAIMAFPEDWCLGYLGVAPSARRRGVGTALASAMLAATATAGVPSATASVAVGNEPIRATLAGVGFAVRSARTDFVLSITGQGSGVGSG
ncbi:GNAT family N-acetyltransferase [Occultella gossypii]|uniref:GNAT family N-acetyltransferase n=1 Tax=Occultella gossypii TaxID=2800820 RepID=A0ABS7SFY8_9MICO|nr:GNAT family N-acetyltransferase [Occultella gossypii]MBZ2198191.1 GNAT family N-acetyltransferase [Occultella gossypii]